MEKYEVIGLLGEGSFGRVYKAKQNTDSTFVALKVISKRGRSVKELKGLRRECEIQRYLHHPNIIQMLDSFETENEIVVITEFAHKELNYILGKEGYLPEERVQAIVWDLLSALYYLHSHRVLHRDLKPQNILLDANNVAKLCDFGFARNMSTGTHVLTSIKGTPLYMAPELIEEQPYDHNADLWSLGCIVYELLVGAPPFCTASILHLIRLIRHEQIQWPTFISDNCISFLKGLLQKNPSKRMPWPEILNHPFVKDHIIITDNTQNMPLTRPMSANTLQVKEQQRNLHITQKTGNKMKTSDGNNTQMEPSKSNTSKGSKNSIASDKNKKSDGNLNDKLSKLSLNKVSTELKHSKLKTPEPKLRAALNFHEDNQPIESEEWIAFLQKTIEEIMNCEIGCLLQSSSTNVLVNPLRNVNASSKVVGVVANLFSLPFIVHGISKDTMLQIQKVYLEVKLVPNLVYASKLMTSNRSSSSVSSTPTPTNSTQLPLNSTFKSAAEFTDDDLQALEYIYLLICHLVYVDQNLLNQFCDAIVVLHMYPLLQKLLTLAKRKLKIVTDLLSILTHVLRKNPENFEIVDRVIFVENEKTTALDFVGILRSNDALLRERCCFLLLFLGKTSTKTVENLWNEDVRDTLEALVYDSIENVRNAAELAVEELKSLEFYKCRDTNEC